MRGIAKNICAMLAAGGAEPGALCEVAQRCGVLPFVYPEAPEAAWRREYEVGFAQDAMQCAELEELRRAFAAAGIDMVPLKGCIMKPLYPGGTHMRTMCDLDLLIRTEDAARVRTLMVARGYQVDAFGMYHHDEYSRPPMLSAEMHRTLVPETERAGAYYRAHDPWERVTRDAEGRCDLPPEDHYLFIVAHFAGHLLERGGSSLRGLLDLYLFRAHYTALDGTYLKRALAEMGLDEFEEKYRRMAQDLFDGEAPQIAAWRRELETMISCGMLGTATVRAARRREEIGGGRLRYIWKRLFPTYRHMCGIYPSLVRHKWLLPICYLRRMVTEPFRQRDAFRAELSMLKTKKPADTTPQAGDVASGTHDEKDK